MFLVRLFLPSALLFVAVSGVALGVCTWTCKCAEWKKVQLHVLGEEPLDVCAHMYDDLYKCGLLYTNGPTLDLGADCDEVYIDLYDDTYCLGVCTTTSARPQEATEVGAEGAYITSALEELCTSCDQAP